jgi:hypothetical protein
MPPVKELHYFDHLYVPENRKWTGWHIKTHIGKAVKWHRENGKDQGPYFRYLQDLLAKDIFTETWYRRAFGWPAAEGKLTGDITPEYCMIDASGVEYVRQLLGDLKVIVMVRDPVERALSQIRMNAKNQKIDLASASESQWMSLATDPVLYCRARYSKFVPLWKDICQAENMLILQYENVANRPLDVLRATERFLGLPTIDYPEASKRIHEGTNKQIQAPEEVLAHLQLATAAETKFFREHFAQ